MAKKRIFGEVKAYQFGSKLFKDKDKFLTMVTDMVYNRLLINMGRRHAQEEDISWRETRRVLSMEKRQNKIRARIRHRIERIL